MMRPNRSKRQRGAALILMVVLGLGLMVISAVSLNMTLSRSIAQRTIEEEFDATQIVESAVAEALGKIKEGGFVEPRSGGGTTAAWVNFSNGQFLYNTEYDTATEISTIRAWSRVAVDATTSSSTVSPDNLNWDGTGWLVHGIEVTVASIVFVPEFPLYFGNGGIERPEGGFEWISGADPADPTSWGTVASGSESSWQSSSVPFEVNALDHPVDYLSSGTPPSAVSGYPHPYQIWASQTLIGQHNIDAWFRYSAGSADASTGLTPPPTSTYYDMADTSSYDHAYPVRSDAPDVQEFAWALWNKYNGSSASHLNFLNSGDHFGTYGTVSDPSVTFVTGRLKVQQHDNFEGAGILVIRDNFDPNVDHNNTPGNGANLEVRGTFKWTGLVVIAGWAPSIKVTSTGTVDVVGALFGEDSVQSGGETSLDSATIIFQVDGPFRIRYSNSIFQPGGLVRSHMPGVKKQIVGYRELAPDGSYRDSSIATAGKPETASP